MSLAGSKKKLNKMLAKQHLNNIFQLRSDLQKIEQIAWNKTTMWSRKNQNYHINKNERKSNKNNPHLIMQGHPGPLLKLQPHSSINSHKKTEGKSTD